MRGAGKRRPAPAEPDQALVKALNHPLRKELLRRYHGATEPLGPKELADALEKPISTVNYHVCELARLGAVELVEEEQRRGSVAHFYEATSLVDEVPWGRAALGLPLSS
jgi:DNA-binding transcriptional ArsR family regulator